MIPGAPRRNPMNGARGLTRQVAAEGFVFDGKPPAAAPDDPGPESDVRGSERTRQAFTLTYDRSDIVMAARLAISGYRCADCGHAGAYHHHYQVDHIIARPLGGEDSLQNTQVLCLFCHADKTWTHAGRLLVPVPVPEQACNAGHALDRLVTTPSNQASESGGMSAINGRSEP
jgi:HNH endonuclease